MGLLDDAIREHLELKRRRGADPAEIERAEREALGPVRRRFEEPGGAFEHEPVTAEDLPQESVEGWPESAAEAAPAGGLDAPEAPAHWEEERQLPPSDPPPASATAAHPSAHGPDTETETSEYGVASEHAAEDEDMLEETPEFLQDTPDHDRLWFEQRPPRDFDFGG
jgi:hypothetical protein